MLSLGLALTSQPILSPSGAGIPAAPTSAVLAENGVSLLLTETGDFILQG